MAGRRTSLASLAGQKVDDVPGKSDPLLLTLPLTKLVPTRFNPRRNFGTEEELKEFGLILKKRQLQPAVVVSRSGYLKLWPEEADNVGDVPYVIANGERRYRASLAAELTTLNVVHNEDVAASRADFLDAVLSENNDREDLDPIERALGIETMVIELGGADQVAAHYGKSKGWVSQQRKLLKLTPELQQLVSQGELPIRVGRDIAGLPQDQQVAAWQEELARRSEAKKPPRPAREPDAAPAPVHDDASSQAARFTAVNSVAPPQPEDSAGAPPAVQPSGKDGVVGPDKSTAVKVSENRGQADAVPEPRVPETPSKGDRGAWSFPYADASICARLLINHMTNEQLQQLTGLVMDHLSAEATSVG
ncbi:MULTISPECIES: ParB/RepB/Spo0J family partition protein [unclassified Streptomyces]|uniref:ParB/RepB/Spo0J family partition protein n=1 Tax=unclassified Streptomyces TaxID=2593676 RepID=UPI00136E48DA|nr:MULTISPECIES: ParB/RepB/Spo0J family partition protein [unclassified Streptomyces]NEA02239.1 ParB/RepB/Spo0J family partition protein [Streptomyces sp. SID10116]MYY80835.1 ParB/RepB/Spo0J family partition protein [Streptomyces sp. SID335]MYZ13283.1 ParB/RepB/Spo0J family partition protein [Streptomyces sp. SID337]NDZ88308.1 ParB/RepB/Spo0J family partition protein [Streptomyces sp. SID10115]NEB49961.1 ParB/RepB/Spo0J family partition protein [Streptomyces sp. SID339]